MSVRSLKRSWCGKYMLFVGGDVEMRLPCLYVSVNFYDIYRTVCIYHEAGPEYGIYIFHAVACMLNKHTGIHLYTGGPYSTRYLVQESARHNHKILRPDSEYYSTSTQSRYW